MASHTPWLGDFLKPIQEEYSRAPPEHHISEPTQEDMKYITGVANDADPFDKGGLKREIWTALSQGSATITSCKSAAHGAIHVIAMKKAPMKPAWNTWWRIVRLLSPTEPVRIVIFASPHGRVPPAPGRPLESQHVNGGAAFPCNPRSIVIYRAEEASRVICHELFHATCSDPYHLKVAQIEADTEAWAEMVLCAMAAKGNEAKWRRFMKQQVVYSVRQALMAERLYGVKGPEDYGWRYLVGRLNVWRNLGLYIPPPPTGPLRPPKTLRFTICEPADV